MEDHCHGRRVQVTLFNTVNDVYVLLEHLVVNIFVYVFFTADTIHSYTVKKLVDTDTKIYLF